MTSFLKTWCGESVFEGDTEKGWDVLRLEVEENVAPSVTLGSKGCTGCKTSDICF